jgi:predicted ester cyclase
MASDQINLTSKLERNKALFRHYLNVLYTEFPESAREFYTPDFVVHAANSELVARGLLPSVDQDREAMIRWAITFRSALADLKMSFQFQIAEGNRVCSCILFNGTHRGAFLGLPPTGRRVKMSVLSLMRLENDRIAETWVSGDIAGLLIQLGGSLVKDSKKVKLDCVDSKKREPGSKAGPLSGGLA